MLIFISINISIAFAQVTDSPQTVTVDGKLYEAGSTTEPLLDSSVVMRVQVLNPAKSCILYEEQHTFSTLATSGNFNIQVGSAVGDPKRSTLDSANNMATVFFNRSTAITGKTSGGGGCAYTPATEDVRHFRFFVTPSTVGSTSQLSPDMRIDSVPQAIVAQTLQGLGKDDVFHTSVTSTQAKLDNLLTTNYSNITDLIGGTSSMYLRNASTGTLLPTRPNDPSSPAAGQLWYDTTANQIKYYDGTAIQSVGASGAGITSLTAGSGLSGGTITTSGTIAIATGGVTDAMLATGIDASKITAGTLPAGVVPTNTDTTKLPLAGGTMTGAITMGAATTFGGFDLLGTGHITMNSQKTITVGRYTGAQETTLISTLTGANAGATWYNSTTNKLMYWNGTSVFELAETTSAGGDITAINTNAGSGLTGGATSGPITLAINVDNNTIEISTNTVQVKDAGITTAKLANDAVTSAKILDGEVVNADISATAAIAWTKIDKTGATAADVGAVPTSRTISTNAGSGLTGGGDLTANRALALNVDNSTVEIATNTVQVKDAGITNAKIASMNITKLTQGAGDYFAYMPAGTECNTGEVLKWNATSDRWLCDTDAAGATDHGLLVGLGDDDHTQYVLLAGRASGQTLRGGVASGEDLTLESTSHATKGDVIIQPTSGNVGIGTTAPTSRLDIKSNISSTTTSNNGLTSTMTSVSSGGAGHIFTGVSGVAESPSSNSTNMLRLRGVVGSATHEGSGNVDLVVGITGGAYNDGTGVASSLIGGDFDTYASGSPVNEVIGVRSTAYVQGTTSPTSIIGGFFGGIKDGAGSTSHLYGVQTYADCQSGSCTNSYGGYFESSSSGGTITNSYGVYVADSIGTNQWGIYQTGTNDRNYFAGNVGIGTATPTVKLDVEGTVQIGDGGETCSIAANAGMIKYTAGTLQYCNGSAWQTLGVSGSGLTTLNGQTGSTQTFAVTATGTAPAINSATNTHTLSIPLASGAGVTSGTISKTDYDSFVAKLSSVTGSTLNSARMWVGDSSNQAAAVLMSGDATLSNTGALTIAADAVTTTKIIDGAVTNAKITSMNITKLTNGAGDYFAYMPAGTECNTGEVLKWNAASDRWLCDTDATGSSDHGTLAGLGDDDHTQYALLAGRASGQNIRGGTASGEDLTLESTSHATKGDLILQPSGGNVGIGTTAPTSNLSFSGLTNQSIGVERQPTANTIGRNLQIQAGAAATGGTNRAGGNLILSSGIATGQSYSEISLNVPVKGTSGTTDITPKTVLKVSGNDDGQYTGYVNVGNNISAPATLRVGAAPQTNMDSTGAAVYMDATSGAALTNKTIVGIDSSVSMWTPGASSNNTGIGIRSSVSGGDAGEILAQKGYYANVDSGNFSTADNYGAQFDVYSDMSANQYGLQINSLSDTPTNNTGVEVNMSSYTSATTSKGLSVTFNDDGTVTNRYGLWLGTPTGTAVVTNDYGIFQQGSSQKNYFAGNVGIGATNPTVKLDVEGTVQIGDGGETCSIAANAGMIKYTAGTLQYCNGSAWQTLGVSGSGLTTLNGQTGSTQTFAVNATGTAPAINSASNTHTLSVPLASGAGVTSGTISKTDYDSFVAKLSAVTGSTLNSARLWVGDSSNQAAAVLMSGDATLSNTGALTIAADAVTTTKIIDGAVTNVKIATMNITKLTNGPGDYFAYMPAGTECNTGEVLKWNATSDRWLCDTDATGSSDHGTLAGLGDDDHTQYALLAGRSGGQVLRGGTASSEDITIESTSHATKGDVILQPTGGNVGIGTTSPGASLDVFKTASTGTISTTGTAVTGVGTNFQSAFSVGDQILVGSSYRTITAITSDTSLTMSSTLGVNQPSGTEYARAAALFNSGNIGVGRVPSASVMLDVAGTIRGDYLYSFGDVKADGDIRSDGHVLIDGAFFTYGGAVNAPAYSFKSNTGTGMWSPATDVLAFSTTSSERIRINSSGNVGIGTTNPAVTLDMNTKTDAVRLPAGTDAQRPTAANGMIRYNTTSNKLEAYENSAWVNIRDPASNTLMTAATGSAAAPSLSFTGETDTGFYNSTTNTIGVSAGGVQVFDFNSTGLVSPTTGGANVLTGNGTAATPTFSFAGDTDTGWFRPAANMMAASTAGSERIRIDASGNVGIGSTVPTQKLDVNGSIRAEVWSSGVNDQFIMENTATPITTGQGSAISFRGGSTFLGKIAAIWDAASNSNSSIIFETRSSDVNSEKMRIGTNGNVGIGTTTPAQKLHIFGNEGLPATSGTTQSGLMRLSRGGGSGVLDFGYDGTAGAGWLQATNSSDLSLEYNILLNPNGGNVGIGTTAPTVALEVNGAIVSQSKSNAAGVTNINFITGNVQTSANTTNNAAFNICGIKEGGSYTLILTGQPVSSIPTFTAYSDAGCSSAITWVDAGGVTLQTTSATTILTFVRAGNTVYVMLATGFTH